MEATGGFEPPNRGFAVAFPICHPVLPYPIP